MRFPKADAEDSQEGGWSLDPAFLKRMKQAIEFGHDTDLSLEQIEACLLVAQTWFALNGGTKP